MTAARYIVGDTLTVLRSMPAASADLILTSPPFLALRSYLPADHPAKAQEMGSEATPGDYLDALLDVVEECRRVLAPHGSLCFELGDTYSGSGGAGGDYGDQGLRSGQAKFDGSGRRNRPADVAAGIIAPTRRPGPEGRDAIPGWPLDKSLCLIPESFRWALVYGRNPFTGRPTPRWRARNVVRWCRPNPPVGALADKVRPATSDLLIACTSRSRYFDLDAVRTPDTEPGGAPPLDHWWHDEDDTFPQDAWLIPTQPYSGSHYATWPESLCVTPIQAMCPLRVCQECGEPSRRITTVGWTDCGHEAWRTGVVLDIFAGSGTTLAVATGHGRDAIGIDLDERNAQLALDRVGPMLLTVEHHQPAEVAS